MYFVCFACFSDRFIDFRDVPVSFKKKYILIRINRVWAKIKTINRYKWKEVKYMENTVFSM